MEDGRYAPVIRDIRSIIGEHISTKMSRYARLTLDIRFLRHHQGAYLLWESSLAVNVEKRCGAPDPSLRLRLRSGRQKAGCVYGDKGGTSSMMTRNVIPSVSEESEGEERDNGPRTRYFCIFLNTKIL